MFWFHCFPFRSVRSIFSRWASLYWTCVCWRSHVALATSNFFSMSVPSVAFLFVPFRSIPFRSVPFALKLFLLKCWNEVMFTLFFSCSNFHKKTNSVRLCKHRGSCTKNLFSPFNRCQNTQLSFSWISHLRSTTV